MHAGSAYQNVALYCAKNGIGNIVRGYFDKEGIGNTNVTLSLVDSFLSEINYENFDSQNKWEYFTQYAATNAVKKPSISAQIKYIEGAGINNNNFVGCLDFKETKARKGH